MKHADGAALDHLEDLLGKLREVDALREKTRGVFYWRSRSFLHFHDDPSGLYADVRVGADFERFPVNSAAQRRALLALVRRQLA